MSLLPCTRWRRRPPGPKKAFSNVFRAGIRNGVGAGVAAGRRSVKKKGAASMTRRCPNKIPAIAYFRTFQHYHWSRELNDRVRNGNVCFLAGKSPGKRRCASGAAFICEKKFKCRSDRKSKWPDIPPLVHGRLKRLHALHLQPINLVVCQGSSEINSTKPYLGDGFTLICFQRLSQPYIATLRCHWRDNRNTRGTSLQILSY